MKALRYHARGKVVVDEVDPPEPADGWTIVAPTWGGICGTDLKQYRYGPIGMPIEPHPLSGAKLPLTLGHEFAGVVRSTSSPGNRIAVGQRVVVDPAVKCGACWYCRHGKYMLCQNGAILGISAHGGLAEEVAVPDYSLHALPDELTDEEGALVEPVAVSVHAVRRFRLAVGETVCIVGGGVIGLCIMLVARASGAHTVGVVEPLPERRDLAVGLGADFAVAPDEAGDLQGRYEGIGADVGVDCVGSGATLAMAIGATRRAGRVGLIGTHAVPAEVDVNAITGTEKELIGSVGYEGDFPIAIRLMRDRRVDPTPLVTGRVALEDAVSEGLEQLDAHPERHIKILVRPQTAQ
jgi:(R,R)-butanediol dehydrogenase/meso-butanediol dehydrogenase/diacetyl reductase